MNDGRGAERSLIWDRGSHAPGRNDGGRVRGTFSWDDVEECNVGPVRMINWFQILERSNEFSAGEVVMVCSNRRAWCFCFLFQAVLLVFTVTTSAGDRTTAYCAEAPENMLSWWNGNDTSEDVFGDSDGVLVNGAGFAQGVVDRAFSFDGQDDYVEIPEPNVAGFGTDPFTVVFWINADGLRDSYHYIMGRRSYSTGRPSRYGASTGGRPTSRPRGYCPSVTGTWSPFPQTVWAMMSFCTSTEIRWGRRPGATSDGFPLPCGSA